MVAIQSCDHCNEKGLIPSNRSRARMLEQLRAAKVLGRGVHALVQGSAISLTLPLDPEQPSTVTVQLAKLLALWEQYQRWLAVEPQGDDWAAPYEPPAEIRVPPEGEAT